MEFKRLLTVGLMALFCAGTATAASQLNSVQVTPQANAATINLRTTGSYAHKEYRPDAHLVLVDLTGVSADPAVERNLALNTAVLKSYKLSSYTSASGSEVTRIELVLGDGISLEVVDRSDGLQILLKGSPASAQAPSSAPSSFFASAASSAPSPLPSPAASTAAVPSPAPEAAAPVAKTAETQTIGPVQSSGSSPARPAALGTTALITIRSVSVQRGHGTLDVIIEGPNSAHPFLLKNPDRLVVDFSNAVVRASVRNIAVHTKDVLQVRVGRFQSEPPVTRIVIDLGGPRSFDVVPSAQQVIVRIKAEDAAKSLPPVQLAPAAAPALAETPVVAPAKLPGVQQKAEVAERLSPAAKPAPAPTLAFVKAPVVAPERPVMVQDSGSSPVLQKPAMASVKAPVVVPANASATQIKSEDAEKVSPPPLKPAPVLFFGTPVAAPVKPEAPQFKADAVDKPSQSKPAPVPVLASVKAPAVAVQMNSSGTGDSAYAKPVSAPGTPAAEPVPVLASNGAPPLREQQISDPKSRAGVAADTMAASPKAGQAPVGMDPLPSSPAAASFSAPRYTGEPISVNLKDVDLKDFFRLIHEISGLNIVLDPSVRGTLTLVLDDVPWDQALDIVLKNNSLDRELQGNVLRIAATDTLRKEAVDRRAQSEAVALAVDRQTITRFLSYAKSKDVVPTIKKFLTARGDVISDERTNALIISDIPSVLPNLDRLISQLDRKSQEVEIEVRVVSATRSFTRDLGVQLGFNWGNGVSTISGLNSLTQSTSTTSAGTTTTTNSNPSTIPLFTNLPATNPTTGFSISNITKSYGIDAILTAAENHNLAKVLSRPRVVTQSNVKAEVKQGVKIPVYTAGTGNANASVSYVDAVLRLSVVPQITSDNTIFLTVDVENTQPSGTINSNYILTTQQATTQVLVTDGGTVVIGGVIQTTNTVSTSQTPVLGNIPWLGNLFKERSVKTETDELIFFITPKIIQT